MTASDPYVVPSHLSVEAAEWWVRAARDHQLDEPRRLVLTAAAESWDRANQARAVVDAEGPVQTDRFGQAKPHPATVVERDNRAAFVRTMTELDLDDVVGEGESFVDQLRARHLERLGELRERNGLN